MTCSPVHLLLVGLLFAAIAAVAAPAPIDLTKTKVVVCLGDSITDGQTYSLMVAQALRAAKRPVPLFIPAGIGGDTAGGMLARLDRDVLPFKPDLVILNCGINDSSRVKTADYEANVRAIAARLQQEHVGLLLLTLTRIRFFTYNEANEGALKAPMLALDAANIILRKTAADYNLPIAEVSKVMATAPKGVDLWAPDGCHLNFEGYRLMSRAILDALGCPEANPPATEADFALDVMPGIIRDWRVHPATAKDGAMDEKRAAALTLDDTWKRYTLPETERGTLDWWANQERRRGFAMQLREKIGPADRFWSYAEVRSRRKATMYVNTGGELGQVYVNGVRVFNGEYSTGWHAGGHRIPVTLQRGVNRIVLVSGGRFFFSLTKTNLWW
jgi:lysophospholipase L1-like esterase